MSLLPLLAVLGVVLWIVDRIMLWCERRGWVTYRRSPRIRHAWGNAAFGIDALLQPDRQHVIELKVEAQDYREDDDDGELTRRRKLLANHDPATRDDRVTDRTSAAGGPERTDVPPALRRE